ncbi:hypothetical protein NXH76_04995 [Blautia schinkii]|nr:hypothetical protein [Blautia schinkii]
MKKKTSKKIWKQLTAVCTSAIVLLNVSSYTYAAEFSAEEVFSSNQEADESYTEELFSSETDIPEADYRENTGADFSGADNVEVTDEGIPVTEHAGSTDTELYHEDEPNSDTADRLTVDEMIELNECVPYISTLFLPNAEMGTYYTAQLEGISNNSQSLRWSINNTNSLPQGIYLTTDGRLIGTPREKGTFILQILADNGQATAARRLELRITETEPAIKAYEIGLEKDITDMGIFPSGGQGWDYIGVRNKGQNALHLKPLPESENFQLSWYDGFSGVIEPGGMAYITVCSREELPDGYYEETVNIATEEGYSAQAVLKINIGPASMKDYDLQISQVIVDEDDFEDPETRVEEFVLIKNIGQKETKITRDASMLTAYRVEDHSINIDDDEADYVHRTLKPGESITLCIVPLHHYGSFHEEFYVYTDDGSKFAVPIIQEIEDPNFLADQMEITPSQIKYDSRYVFYEEAPEPREISVKNKSSMAVTLFQQGDVGLRIGKLDKTRLEPGETASFAVQPATGLSGGDYTWWINVNAQSDDGKNAVLSSRVSFRVYNTNFEGIDEFSDVSGLMNGTEKAVEALRLPTYVWVNGYEGDEFSTLVEWNIEECPYDPSVKEEQIFTVKGNLLIPPEQNNKHLDTSVEIQVQVKAYDPLSRPVIDSVFVSDNYLMSSLYDKSNEATGYQFVLVKNEADLEKENFVKTQNSTSTSVTIKTIQKGEYFLHCRAYKKAEGKTTYGDWSEGKQVSVTVTTGKAPKITKATVNGCDVRITVTAPDKTAGFDAVLAKKKSGGMPVNYVVTKANQSSKKNTIVLNGAPKGTYYVAVHSYTIQNGRKILSPWSNLIKVTVKKGKITTPPVIKKVSVSGRKVTIVTSRAKGTAGSDWILANRVVYNNDGTYNSVYDYAYIQKNKTAATISFKNVKPGTYYLIGHAYMKGYAKSFTNWSGIRKVVVK